MTFVGLLGGWILVWGEDTPQRSAALGITALVFVAFGPPLIVVSWRLIANRPRSDGGLMPPTALRFASIIFVVGWTVAVARHPIFGLAETATMFAAAAGCFALARHRERYLNAELERLAHGGQPTVNPSDASRSGFRSSLPGTGPK
jgi:hypothetical protein